MRVVWGGANAQGSSCVRASPLLLNKAVRVQVSASTSGETPVRLRSRASGRVFLLMVDVRESGPTMLVVRNVRHPEHLVSLSVSAT